MKALVQLVEAKTADFFKNNSKYIFGGFFIGIMTYFMMMSQNLVNDLDGIWHLSNFIAGDWEISLGRGLQRYADRARFGIVSDPFNTMLTLLLVCVANAMIVACFDWESKLYRGLFFMLLVANPIICNSLSYSYMSVNFGLAYFFSVVAFLVLKVSHAEQKGRWIGIFFAGLFLGVSMAFYQAYIGVTSVLVVMYALKMLLDKKTAKTVLQYLGIAFGTYIVGGGLYLGITKLLLYRAGVEMASYKGASNHSILLMVQSLPQSLKECYVQFWDYFFAEKAYANLEFAGLVMPGLLCVSLIAVLVQLIRLLKRDKPGAVLFLVLILLLPVAGCFVLLIAVGNGMSGLMAMGMLLSIVMLGSIVPKDGKSGFWLKRVYLLLLVAFAWYQLSAVVNDQLALKEGKTATITLTENIVSRLYDEGYLEEYDTVAFVGRPAENARFSRSTAYEMANGYAQFGCWSTDARNNRVSWEGVTYNFLGVHLNFCGDTEYREITSLNEVAEMPEFPARESIQVINGVVVVKVSDLY